MGNGEDRKKKRRIAQKILAAVTFHVPKRAENKQGLAKFVYKISPNATMTTMLQFCEHLYFIPDYDDEDHNDGEGKCDDNGEGKCEDDGNNGECDDDKFNDNDGGSNDKDKYGGKCDECDDNDGNGDNEDE